MACRNLEKGERLMESEGMLEGDREESERRCQVMHLDLASMKSVRKFAEVIAKRHGTINVLINNAGVLTGVKADTEDGHEIHFGVNYLGHFYLTYLLLPTLMTSFPARIINVASHVESFPVDFNELNCRKSYLNAYGRSKACNIMFTVHLAKLLKNTHVKTCSLHPGYVATNLAADVQDTCLLRSIKCYMTCTCKKLVKPDEGAMMTMMCCEMVDEEMENGGFYRDSMLSKPPKHCRDAMRCEKLWKGSCEMCHLPEDLRLHLLQK
ncbi:hypothetical protein HELRODRAFT_185285 [Helobdella robusta]|uniref:Uncharacterized protein n=1 Tax=Helobdella robusta TaxID=6412 RepID=T1FML9_HELRO|nr:hypothetical protein HELRODRAFT_185285 [Helobdella robusta]ESO10827.1 hypothetical protein HELRODRAFT_185285 [Helobdella robusta]